MSDYTYRDFDGDTLGFIAGNSSVLVTAYSESENEAISVDVRKLRAIEVAQALLEAAGINAKISVEEL